MFSGYGREFVDDPVVMGFRSALARLHELTGGGRLVDVGIGSGLLLHLARQSGFVPLGVEISASAAESARREFGVEVLEGSFEAIELPGPVDVITLADVIEHTQDPLAFVRRAATNLRPGGVLFVAVPNHASVLFRIADLVARLPVLGDLARRLYVPNHYWYFSPKTLTRLLERADLEVCEVRQADPFLGRYRLALPVRVALGAILAMGRALGRRGRIEVFARRRAPDAPSAGRYTGG